MTPCAKVLDRDLSKAQINLAMASLIMLMQTDASATSALISLLLYEYMNIYLIFSR